MSKVLSLFFGILLGKLKEVKDVKDVNGSPQVYFCVTQVNPLDQRHTFDHWIKAWGKTAVASLSEWKVGTFGLVAFRGQPYNRKYNDKDVPSMQNQVLFLFPLNIGSILKHNNQDTGYTGYESNEQPQQASEDEVPF